MSGLSHEQFIDICRTKFDFGPYLDDCIKYYNDGSFDNFDGMTGEPVKIPESAKHLFSLLKIVSQTELGKNLFQQLDENTKVSFIIDEREKQEAYGYSTNNHLIAITDINRNPFSNATTLMHELTHEVQKQQGGNSRFLPTEQDRFMTNKMMESEARLNTCLATRQILFQMKNEEEINSFIKSMTPQDVEDYMLYKKLLETGASQEDINRQMLQSFYQDTQWNQSYNEQGLNAAGYRMSCDVYLAKNTASPEIVQKQYMKRMGLSEEDAKFFFNPSNISDYPVGQIKQKSEKLITIDENTTLKNIYENNQLVYRAKLNGDKVVSEERIINDITVTKKYNEQGDLLTSIREYTDSDGICHKIYQTKNKEPYEVTSSSNEGILKIATLDGKEIADAKTINQEYSNVMSTFNDILGGKDVNNENIQKAYATIQNDQFNIYEDGLQQVISNAARQHVKNEEISVQKEDTDKSNEEISVQKEDTDKRSEEIILDEMLKEGKLTKEQEDKILEMAILIEQKRIEEKGAHVENNYAEQFIDKLKDSNDFSNEQKDMALNAAIKAENAEKTMPVDRIRQLRGIAPHNNSTGNTKSTKPTPALSSVIQQHAIKNR